MTRTVEATKITEMKREKRTIFKKIIFCIGIKKSEAN